MINSILTVVITSGYNLILNQLAKVKDEIAKGLVIRNVERSRELALSLVDRNPDNAQQVQDFIKKYDEVILDDFLNTGADLADRSITNDQLRAQIVFVLQAIAAIEIFDNTGEGGDEEKILALEAIIDELKEMQKTHQLERQQNVV